MIFGSGAVAAGRYFLPAASGLFVFNEWKQNRSLYEKGSECKKPKYQMLVVFRTEWLRQMLGVTAALWLSLVVAVPAGAQPGGMATDEGLEISGLILDETKTKIGRDFFEYFTAHWQEIKGIQYTITITELPSAIRGSILRIKWNDEVIYETLLNPRPGQIEQIAQQAVQNVQIYVLRKLTTQQQLEKEFQY